MTSPVFPVLLGQRIDIKKKPTMSTIVAKHVSGREVRAALYQNPIWQFEVAFEGLDSTMVGQYGALGAQSMQSLLGLFLQCGGQFGSFAYYDPTDYAVAAQTFGVGDGTSSSFQLTRTIGVFTENVVAPFQPSGVSALPAQNLSNTLLSNNLTTNSVAAGAVAGSPGTMPTGWSTYYSGTGITRTINSVTTVGGLQTLSMTITGTPSVSSAYTIYVPVTAAAVVGNNFVASISASATNTTNIGSQYLALLQRNSGGGTVVYDNQPISLSTSVQRFANPSSISNATVTQLGPLTLYLYVTAGQPINLTLTLAGAQMEQNNGATTPTAYTPTGTTPYWGQPVITAAGAFVDPSAYTIANGVVTFTSAPASGATLAWSGSFGFLCRFDDDTLDFDQFMSNLWQVESLKFRSLRGQ